MSISIPANQHNGWFLNGTKISDRLNLPEKSIETLKYEGQIAGCEVFSTFACGPGDIEFWMNGRRIALIHGLVRP